MGAVPAVRQGAGRCKRGLAGDAVPAFTGQRWLGARGRTFRPRPELCGADAPQACLRHAVRPRIPRNHGSGGQQAALPGAGGFPGGKMEPKQKALSIGKGACIRFGCTPLRFCCVTGSDPLHTALWACFRPPERLRAQPSGRVLLPRGCRPASRSTSWRSPGTGRS